MTKIEDMLPEKGRDIVAIDREGNKYWCYRCACKSQNCRDFRCPITGSMIMIDPVEWEYEEEHESRS